MLSKIKIQYQIRNIIISSIRQYHAIFYENYDYFMYSVFSLSEINKYIFFPNKFDYNLNPVE